MDITARKKQLRKKIKEIKSTFSFEEKEMLSILILNNLEKDISFINSDNILAYWSMDDEVNTHSFIIKWSNSKKIYLPVVVGTELEFRLFTSIKDMKKDAQFGIYEPTGNKLDDFSKIDFAIIPGVAFDKDNNRLGRGRAFYDRILNSISAHKAGICFDFQMVAKVPTEITDIKMDKVYSN
ncbi:MAG: 5-formyltetrahydrofolate cyclo-ligase [Bacteroidetes bacterium 4572_112]|nr:MAG: 5-formyltetrahydrofolate cyclo-ligase [Bacteroidetes bacterium 4572_112]